MATITTVSAPAGAWTPIDPGNVSLVRVQNVSMHVPLRIAIKATEPSGSDGYILLKHEKCYIAELPLTNGQKVWAKPADHSGHAGLVSVVF